MEHIYNCRPQEGWNHIYTDCSAEYARRNYGVGVYMQYLGGSEDKTSLATMCSTNFKIEAKRQTIERPTIHPDPLKSKHSHFAVDTFP